VKDDREEPPVKYCPVKGCRKKMAAFRRGRGWKYICPDEPQHAADKLKARQRTGDTSKGGVKPGTPSPLRGKPRPEKPYRTRYDWRRKPKDGNGEGK
jgi:hypothetical protein